MKKRQYVCNVSSKISPLIAPEMNFQDQDHGKPKVDYRGKKEVLKSGEIEPLVAPEMNFDKD